MKINKIRFAIITLIVTGLGVANLLIGNSKTTTTTFEQHLFTTPHKRKMVIQAIKSEHFFNFALKNDGIKYNQYLRNLKIQGGLLKNNSDLKVIWRDTSPKGKITLGKITNSLIEYYANPLKNSFHKIFYLDFSDLFFTTSKEVKSLTYRYFNSKEFNSCMKEGLEFSITPSVDDFISAFNLSYRTAFYSNSRDVVNNSWTLSVPYSASPMLLQNFLKCSNQPLNEWMKKTFKSQFVFSINLSDYPHIIQINDTVATLRYLLNDISDRNISDEQIIKLNAGYSARIKSSTNSLLLVGDKDSSILSQLVKSLNKNRKNIALKFKSTDFAKYLDITKKKVLSTQIESYSDIKIYVNSEIQKVSTTSSTGRLKKIIKLFFFLVFGLIIGGLVEGIIFLKKRKE